uniref:cAMP-dependent protein kinase inhibitor gamma n=1 Tax=Crocodylus porosus TaxID=8502 RepID=A0A7M4EYR5_CROPO
MRWGPPQEIQIGWPKNSRSDQASSKEHVSTRDSHIFGNANEVMEVEATYSDFISCDRAGRRNAVHDIQGDASAISMRKLAGNISELSIEASENQAGATSSEKEPGTRPEGRDGGTSS